MNRKKLGMIQLALVLSTIITSGLCLTYALVVSWRTNATFKVTADINVKAYFDASCNLEITSLDLGSIRQGDTSSITIYIKNLGTQTITLDWGSDLTSISNNYAGDAWEYYGSDGNWHNIRGYNLGAGASLTTRYRVVVATTCPVQSFSYTLELGSV